MITVADDYVKRARTAAIGLALFLAGGFPVLSADDTRVEDPTDMRETRDGASGHATATDGQARKDALTLGFIMLGSIIVGGTILLVLVVMWGNRTRRLARKPLPAVAQRDELWFLKPKKNQDLTEPEGNEGPGGPADPETN